jgi:two-component sensor histidine kinase
VARDALSQTLARIQSVTLVHEQLHRQPAGANAALDAYLATLSRAAVSSGDRPDVRLDLDLEEVHAPVKVMVPMGLVVNEAVSNALRHAFDGVESPRLAVSLRLIENDVEVRVRDNGRPAQAEESPPADTGEDRQAAGTGSRRAAQAAAEIGEGGSGGSHRTPGDTGHRRPAAGEGGFGLTMMEALAEQLGGTLTISAADGTEVELRFPLTR